MKIVHITVISRLDRDAFVQSLSAASQLLLADGWNKRLESGTLPLHSSVGFADSGPQHSNPADAKATA